MDEPTQRGGSRNFGARRNAVLAPLVVLFWLLPMTSVRLQTFLAADEAAGSAIAQTDPIAALQETLKNSVDLKTIASMPFAEKALTREQAAQAERLLWAAHVSLIRHDREAEMQAQQIHSGQLSMRFDFTVFGKKPAKGHSLYLSMHGGGATSPQVNDSQWENQKRLYRLNEGIYIAPRAPTNTWNLWHETHIDALFARLIENMIVFENVDPDRVYLMGYSAGGDGVYQLAPRMADRWAAAAMMAGHPNETSALGLRNIGFTIHVGERDSGYDRNRLARQWKQQLASLRQADPGGYAHHVQIHQGKGHWMDRQDAVALDWMSKFTRDVRPSKIVWKQDDVRHQRFYWLAIDDSETNDRALVVATRERQRFDIETSDLKSLRIRLDDSMVDFDKPIVVTSGDKTLFTGKATRTIKTIARTLAERGDPRSIFSGEVKVAL